MGKYNILLVDDEELRVGIREKICWETLGFSLVGEAANGQDALELAEQLCPDVVLTDIKMPFMDGLELCRRLKQQFPAIRLVIFSGFDEFAYAKQAIGMNVFEYLLKPLNAAELSEVLHRLHEEMDKELAQRQFHMPLTVGVGLPVEQPANLALSAQGVESALAYRMILGTGKTFYIGDLEPRQTIALIFGERDEQELINAVKLGTPEKVRQFLQGVLQSSKETSLRQFQCYFLELLTCLIHLAREGDIPLEKVFGAGFSGAIQLTDFASPNDLAQ